MSLETNRQKNNTLRDIIKTFREIHAAMPIEYAEALLVVALKPGITQVELSETLNMSTSNTSRIIAEFFQRKHGLVKQEAAADNFRSKCIFLTDKGERFVQRLQSNLK